MRPFLFVSALCLAPGLALAVGSNKDTPPKPTQTTTVCAEGTVWSDAAKKCVAPQESSLSDDDLYEAARELAYAGRYNDTLLVLAAMSDPMDDRVLTYKGFVHRSKGDTELGYRYYRQALDVNPDNLLARSYMAQGFVAEGRLDDARAQLTEIRARGGRSTWAETALRLAIDEGRPMAY